MEWPTWELRAHGSAAPALVPDPATPDDPSGSQGAGCPLPRLDPLGPWCSARLTFADGARVDVLVTVSDDHITVEDVRADPPLTLAGLTDLARWIEGPLDDAFRAATGRPHRTRPAPRQPGPVNSSAAGSVEPDARPHAAGPRTGLQAGPQAGPRTGPRSAPLRGLEAEQATGPAAEPATEPTAGPVPGGEPATEPGPKGAGRAAEPSASAGPSHEPSAGPPSASSASPAAPAPSAPSAPSALSAASVTSAAAPVSASSAPPEPSAPSAPSEASTTPEPSEPSEPAEVPVSESSMAEASVSEAATSSDPSAPSGPPAAAPSSERALSAVLARSRAGERRRLAADAYRQAQREGNDPVLAVMLATGRSRRRSLRLIAGARDEGLLTPRHNKR
ncbi:DUF6214 family protein [Streptomyces sp. NPDC048516]|uniref:DUF6214 family protein n=1 Tax=Streptomyces sp. NPDC048516 TaxID=3365565 RepID=UPI003716D9C1